MDLDPAFHSFRRFTRVQTIFSSFHHVLDSNNNHNTHSIILFVLSNDITERLVRSHSALHILEAADIMRWFVE